jgi:NADH:ubiquinone oxidoreductase subunit 2 (subunit N)
VLHRRAAAVPDEALDLRPASSASSCRSSRSCSPVGWPAAITGTRSPRRARASERRRRRRDRDPERRLARALADAVAARGSGVALLGRVLVPRGCAARSARRRVAGFVTAASSRASSSTSSADGSADRGVVHARPLGALAQVIVAARRCSPSLVSWGDRRRDHVGEYYALLAAAGAGWLLRHGREPDDAVPRARVVLDRLYVLCAIDTHREASLEAGLKYLIVGAFGSAMLLFGSALVYGATGELGFRRSRDGGAGDDAAARRARDDDRRPRFKASAAPFHMWTPDVYEGAPTPVTAFMSAATKAARSS